MRNFQEDRVRRSTVILSIGAAGIFALVFGVIPAAVLIDHPLHQEYLHIDSTFGTVLIVPTSIVAGFGFHFIDRQMTRAGIVREFGPGSGWHSHFFAFSFCSVSPSGADWIRARFALYAAVVLTAAVFAPWLILNLTRGRLTFFGIAICVIASLLVLGRGASYPPVRISRGVFEPAQRVSLAMRPAIVERLAPSLAIEPARVTSVNSSDDARLQRRDGP